jgi:hypothetical protein
MEYNYNDSYKRHPIETGTAVFEDGSMLKVHDIMDPLPIWMKRADMIITDSPWNTGNLRTFYTKAQIEPSFDARFETFMNRLFECIKEIDPATAWLEIGKQYLADYLIRAKQQFRHVTFFNSMYYKKKDNVCYFVRAGKKALRKPKGVSLDGMDEADIIAWAAANEPCRCIADLCMGRGLTALAAYENGINFVGTELNHKRLSVTLERLAAAGAKYKIQTA